MSGRSSADATGARRKVYVPVPGRPELRVPFAEVVIGDSPGPAGPVANPPIRLYDTSGPGSDPERGLPPLRRSRITARGDVEEYEGRPVVSRDDGRAAARRGGNGTSAIP